jgi:hypothetical protein
VWISAVDAYSEMELCTLIWLNHDLGDAGVVNISAVDAYSGVEVCTLIFLIHISFLKIFKTQMDTTSLNKAQHKQVLLHG